MAYYNTCPICGCNLDPSEKCECQDRKLVEERKAQIAKMPAWNPKRDSQYEFKMAAGFNNR